ncbi:MULTISPECIES: thymidine kinase [Peptoniphilus]|uniref:thymidine kinase n=1 Tax=Peptoniphilus TaxID=162289 RepID=UPI0001DAA435|nr:MULTISPECIES: thymidine kinase [Peptoniphilus]EFI41347.1 thymidine kinase [Peptoniphilus sp. oral taxon 386 str. F0131]
MHQYKGRLIVHTGSMFSGKTSSLEREMKRFAIAGYKTVAFKPSIDTRADREKIVTHDNTYLSAVMVNNIFELVKYVSKSDFEVVGIDEVQFLGGEVEEILKEINELLNSGKTVVVAGLDMDYTSKPFEIVKELMSRSDYLNKHHAVCTVCGADAWVSHRKTKSDERIVIGATEEYEPLCRNCYNEILKKELDEK